MKRERMLKYSFSHRVSTFYTSITAKLCSYKHYLLENLKHRQIFSRMLTDSRYVGSFRIISGRKKHPNDRRKSKEKFEAKCAHKFSK